MDREYTRSEFERAVAAMLKAIPDDMEAVQLLMFYYRVSAELMRAVLDVMPPPSFHEDRGLYEAARKFTEATQKAVEEGRAGRN